MPYDAEAGAMADYSGECKCCGLEVFLLDCKRRNFEANKGYGLQNASKVHTRYAQDGWFRSVVWIG